MPSIRDFETWLPLLAVMRAIDPDGLASPGSAVSGQVDARGGWGYTGAPQFHPSLANAVRAVATQTGIDPIGLVQAALKEAGLARVSFVVKFSTPGRAVLHLLELGPAVEPATGGIGMGSLVLAEGALPELWRRQPSPAPRARPAESADPELLERTLRERLPGAAGATEAQISAAETRLGLALPDELKALYRVTRAHWGDWGEHYAAAIGCYPAPLDQLHIATAATRPLAWMHAAQEAAPTSPSAAVQALVGSPGWLVFGNNGSGDRVAIDLTPGPRGNIGQVIMISRHENYGAGLFARSLTDLVLGKKKRRLGSRPAGLPAVARVNRGALQSIEAAAGPDLEVLSIGVWEGEPLSLAPVAGLPRLRTLTAFAGTLADPLHVAMLPGLEYLELGIPEWRALLDADAVPRGLLAAGIEPLGNPDPLELVTVANELLARWRRPQITQTVLEGSF